MTWTKLETFTRADGKRRLIVAARGDGLFSYEEAEHLFEDMTDLGLKSFWYWSPIFSGGLYGTAAEAKRDAVATTPWLRDQLEPPATLT